MSEEVSPDHFTPPELENREPVRITIPDPNAFKRRLVDLDKSIIRFSGLLSGSQWERSAIVYAYTRDDDKGGRRTVILGQKGDEDSPGYRYSISGFTDLHIRGLATRESVRRYRAAWIWASGPLGQVTSDIEPGHETDLPTVEFPEFRDYSKPLDADGKDKPAKRTRRQGRRDTTGLTDPELEQQIRAELNEHPEMRDRILADYGAPNVDPTAKSNPADILTQIQSAVKNVLSHLDETPIADDSANEILSNAVERTIGELEQLATILKSRSPE